MSSMRGCALLLCVNRKKPSDGVVVVVVLSVYIKKRFAAIAGELHSFSPVLRTHECIRHERDTVVLTVSLWADVCGGNDSDG
jgi:hypothetical protein